MKKLLISILKTYQQISYALRMTNTPLFAATTCKFYPSCSEYAVLAVDRYGALQGSLKAAGRVCRCHPWSAGGLDQP